MAFFNAEGAEGAGEPYRKLSVQNRIQVKMDSGSPPLSRVRNDERFSDRDLLRPLRPPRFKMPLIFLGVLCVLGG